MAQTTLVIALKQDFDPDELPTICLQQEYDDGTKENMEVPIIYSRSIEANLYAFNEYLKAAAELNFDAGDKIFKYFCHILQVLFYVTWCKN
jgi:hypothetical protein